MMRVMGILTCLAGDGGVVTEDQWDAMIQTPEDCHVLSLDR